jgi:hypothetical protein
MAIFLMVAGLAFILVARGAGRRRRDAKAVERAVLKALPTLTCETRGNVRHCWDQRGNTVLTEERSPGGYTHSWTPGGKAFTTWDHNGLSTTWPTR